MIKKSSQKNQQTILIFIMVFGAALTILSATVLFLKNPITPEASEERSLANQQLIKEAKSKRDISICDQIVDGIRGRKPIPVQYDKGVVMEGSAGSPPISEAVAKKRCREGVRQEIEQQKQLQEGSMR